MIAMSITMPSDYRQLNTIVKVHAQFGQNGHDTANYQVRLWLTWISTRLVPAENEWMSVPILPVASKIVSLSNP